jgi:hypothetical protein
VLLSCLKLLVAWLEARDYRVRVAQDGSGSGGSGFWIAWLMTAAAARYAYKGLVLLLLLNL